MPRASTVTSLIFIAIGAVTILAIVGGLVAMVIWFLPGKLINAEHGDCLNEVEGTFRVVDCEDPHAWYVLLATKHYSKECLDVPGADQVQLEDGRAFCIGMAGADPEVSINGIAVGECLADGANSQRVECGPGTLTVLAILKDVAKDLDDDAVFGLCDDAEGDGNAYTDTYFSWGLEIEGTEQLTWDRVLCLAETG